MFLIKKSQLSILSIAILIISLSLDSTAWIGAAAENPVTPGENSDAFLDMVQKQTFQYFLNEYHPTTGLINDSSLNSSGGARELRASIAATGFGITAFVIGAERGWISKKEAYERILTAATFFDERAENEHGFFYHFLEGEQGGNVYDSELSSIDTALLLAGLLTARAYFPDTELAGRVDRIYQRVDFDWMRNGTPHISMGWNKESGFLPVYWSSFDEALLLYILATGSPAHAVPPDSWQRVRKPVVEREGETFVFAGPLFIHQYPHVWLDLKNKNDGFADYFENSARATRANKRFAEASAEKFRTYKVGFWGLSATDGPGGYRAYGAIDQHSHDGTVSPAVAGASIVFTPHISLAQLRMTYAEKKKEMWGRYGFSDAMNLDRNWYSEKVIGIDAGALLAMIENYRSGLVWKLFMKNETIQNGLEKAGFVEGTKEPSLPSAPSYVARYVEQPFQIDGSLEEWTGGDSIRLDETNLDYGAVLSPEDLSGQIMFRWNDQYLFLAANVNDDEFMSKRTIRYSYKDDLLELFFDLDGDGFRWKSKRDPQFGFSLDPETKKPRLYNWGEEKEVAIGNETLVAAKPVSGGYMIEAALPWSLFSIVPSNPLEISVTPAIHDADGENEEAKLSWHFRDRGAGRGIELGRIHLKKSKIQ